jgi:catechol 2,3-dioxygenase-like lactoylglutathione lyase family enzyme
MALKRLDNIGIVVDDLELTIGFFQELGLHLEGRATIEGEWQDVSPDLPISASRLP